ncbi:MAG: hypothetical protein V2J51_00540 [Erythrobacter sp.]|nr:hypothetical protein [Erythrobacter sp.]
MELRAIEHSAGPQAAAISDVVIAQHLVNAVAGDATALFELGVVYSTGGESIESDLIEAHKFFNLAAARGHCEAGHCRAEIADEMTAREIAEAQRRARRWLDLERQAA